MRPRVAVALPVAVMDGDENVNDESFDDDPLKKSKLATGNNFSAPVAPIAGGGRVANTKFTANEAATKVTEPSCPPI